jgi:sugar/nucleoside kinase (ribokinase family)
MRLAKACPSSTLFWAVGTSVAKNSRFLSIVDALDVLVVNELESDLFKDHQPKLFVVTRANRGAELYDHLGNVELFSSAKERVVDATGAGDAFVAGLAFGFLREGCIRAAMPYAHACAKLTLATMDTVNKNLSQDYLLDIMHP